MYTFDQNCSYILSKIRLSFFLFVIGSFLTSGYAQTDDVPSPVVFIYDASGSMWGRMQGRIKMEIAREVLSATVDGMPENQRIGLVAYGHRVESDCSDVEVMVDFDNVSKRDVHSALNGIQPLGRTPLAYSASQVIDGLQKNNQGATIILVTDGIESCGGQLCEVIRKAKDAGIHFKLHIVGFGLKTSETEELRCAALAGEGQYFDAQDAKDLESVLEEATTYTIDEDRFNLTVFVSKNDIGVDAYVRAINSFTKEDAGSVRTYADTGKLFLPPGTFDLEVKPLEGSDVSSQRVSEVKIPTEGVIHRSVSFDAGKAEIFVSNNEEGWDATIRVYLQDKSTQVASGRTYGNTKVFELNPGLYDFEIIALNVKGAAVVQRMEGIRIEPDRTVTPEYNYQTGIVLIGARSGASLVDASINIVDPSAGQGVAGGRTYTAESSNPKEFILLPGTYEVTVTALGAHKGKRERFTIEAVAGKSITRILDF